jgi:NADH-quinone oxidoreductase subunit M
MPLSVLIWLPFAVTLIGVVLPRALAPRVALLGAMATLGIAVGLAFGFDGSAEGLQQVTDETWISELGVHYKLGLDGLNLFLVLLTALIFVSALLAANLQDWDRPRLFYMWMGLAETAVLGAFLAQDLLLFVLFFDLMLIPFYFLTGAWGGPDRIAATTRLVIYTLVGSLLMLAAAVATAVLATPEGGDITFVLTDLQALPLPEGSQNWIFLCFAAAFLVKMPAFPLHGWMPDGYRNMPLPVLAVFSGVLSKVAAYGFLRVSLPLFPEAALNFQDLLLVIALISILYGSVMAFTTSETRLIVGYSSVAQMGFITLGIFSLRPEGAQGAVLQMINHGLVAAPLLFIIGILAARAGSDDLRHMGGLAFRAPVLAAMFLIVALATLAIPGSANFAAEFLILLGVFKVKLVFAIVAIAGVVLAAVYMLRAYIRAMHNRLEPNAASREMSVGDGLVVVPLVLVILALAFYPQVALQRSEATVAASIAPARAAFERIHPPDDPADALPQPETGEEGTPPGFDEVPLPEGGGPEGQP